LALKNLAELRSHGICRHAIMRSATIVSHAVRPHSQEYPQAVVGRIA
jgi:hypothetical protein